jgi:hypothetical protein
LKFEQSSCAPSEKTTENSCTSRHRRSSSFICVRFQFRALSFGQKHKIWLLTWGILTLSAVLVGSANSKSAMVSSKNVCRESADVDEEVWKGGQSNLNAS